MKTLYLIFAPVLVTYFLSSCKLNWKTNKYNNTVFIDTSKYTIDTTIKNVNLDDSLFAFQFVKQKLKNNEVSENYVGILAINEMTNKIAFIDTNDALFANTENGLLSNEQYKLFKNNKANLNEKGKLFFEQTVSGGGSGYVVNLYGLSTRNGNLIMFKIFRAGELDFYEISEDGNWIIRLCGIWNFEQNETHFSEHRFKIIYYHNEKYNFDKRLERTTYLKYSNVDEGKSFHDIVSDIRSHEPALWEQINLEEFKSLKNSDHTSYKTKKIIYQSV